MSWVEIFLLCIGAYVFYWVGTQVQFQKDTKEMRHFANNANNAQADTQEMYQAILDEFGLDGARAVYKRIRYLHSKDIMSDLSKKAYEPSNPRTHESPVPRKL